MRGTRIAVAAVAAMSLLLASTAPAAIAYTPDSKNASLQRDLDALTAAGVTGAQAETYQGHRRVKARSGVAELGTGKPVPRGGYFRMGSNTKTFVAVVILQLVAEKRLSLEDKVDHWLPGVISTPGGREITVRQLLQHTSGLYNYTRDLPITTAADFLEHRFDPATAEQMIAIAMSHEPDFAPGTSWDYSNTNYLLAGLLIEKLTGHSWSQEVSQRILKPLGLRQTFSPGSTPTLPKPHAKGYSRFPGTTELVETTDMNPAWGGAAGDMITTTADLATFWQALMTGRLLPKAQFAEMRKTVIAVTWQESEPGAAYGLGIGSTPLSCGGVSWGHGGDIHGWATRNGSTSDGRHGVVLSQSSQDFGVTHQQARTVIDNELCD